MPPSNSVVSNTTPNGQLVDTQGRATFALLKWMQNVGKTVNGGFDPDGNYQGKIGAKATIVGRETLATIVQHLSDVGVIQSEGLIAATSLAQGAVVMPPGAVNNILGSAAIEPSSAFDPAGAAAAAQTAAEAHADAVATAAQTNAESAAATALAAAFAPGISITITTAKLTVAGATGSMTFTNGLLTGQVAAT